MLRSPLFWIAGAVLFAGSVLFAFTYFSSAYPIVTLDLRMDRQSALQSARDLAAKHGWGPEGFRQAASFRLDSKVQNFVELETGGAESFSRMLKVKLYSPYTWRVRHFKENETNEALIRFTPSGQPYGFVEKLAEDEPGASLTPDSAQGIAERVAREEWNIAPTDYELVERSQEIRPGGRTDHTFVYERPDVQIGDGRYRLRMVVGGNTLTELTHFIKIPEAFSRRYEEMRSANHTIASTAFVATAVFYVLGGCIIGLFLLLRQRWIIWRTPLFWGFFVAFLQVLAQVNEWPLAWMDYDTALSAQGFLLRHIMELALVFIASGVFFTLVFMAAESLTRRAFPLHIRLWRAWSPDVSSSPALLGRTIGGYLLVGFFFAFDVALYFFASRVLGWWTPSDVLFQPDVLATYLPWLSSVAISLQAGFVEECLFRAVPIAGAALLGHRFGHRRAWIIGALFVQALIFGAGHANYPQQPAYARVVELIVPSFGFALIYLYLGLVPAIVLHFAVDVVWFALPLFVSTAPGVWFNQMMVVVLTFVPLWVVLRARLRKRAWMDLKEEHYNRSWQPPARMDVEGSVPEVVEALAPPRTVRGLLLGAGLVGLVMWIVSTNFQNDAPSVELGRKDAEALAEIKLLENGVELPQSWRTLSCVEIPLGRDDRFVWQEGGQEAYEALMTRYVSPPHWKVRFAQFEGDVAERAEEYQVLMAGDGEVFRFRHVLPEARAGSTLVEDEARRMVHSVIVGEYELEPAVLKEISAVPSKLPARTDWLFTFADTLNYPLQDGEARIAVHVAGDNVVDSYVYTHVPEEWARHDRNERNLTAVVETSCSAILVLALLAGAVGAVVSWSRKRFSLSTFLFFFLLLLAIETIRVVNGWPCTLAQFSTAEPVANQLLVVIAASIVGAFFLSAFLALLAGLVQSWGSPRSRRHPSDMVWLGFFVGTFVAGLFALISAFQPSLGPYWAEQSDMGDFVPTIGACIAPVENYIKGTLLFLLVIGAVDHFTKGWTRRTLPFSLVLIGTGLVVRGAAGVDSLPFWLFSGLLAGGLLLLVYCFVLRLHRELVPLALGSLFVLGRLRQGILNAHPAAIPGAVLAVVLIVLLSLYWHRRLKNSP